MLKPKVLWDKQHSEYGRFNPFEKKKENEYISFHLKLISGQYLTDISSISNSGNNNGSSGYVGTGGSYSAVSSSAYNNSTTNSNSNNHSSYRHLHRGSAVDILQTSSTFIEIEIIGIPCDCTKEKTKAFNKNALNPIWNEEFVFHIVFPDLAFVKFSVIDNNNNHLISQRVMPLKCLRQGYRHLKMRNPQNQSLELSTIFIHSKQQSEFVLNTPTSLANASYINSASSIGLMSMGNLSDLNKSQAKHKQFKLTVYGPNSDDEYKENGVNVKVTQDTTVQQVIEQVSYFFVVLNTVVD